MKIKILAKNIETVSDGIIIELEQNGTTGDYPLFIATLDETGTLLQGGYLTASGDE